MCECGFRLWRSGILHSVNCSRKTSGKALNMRKSYISDFFAKYLSQGVFHMYSLDIYFWYDVAFGSPVARVQGVGYVQELVARLTNTPIETHNSSTNATLNDNPVTFPLGNSLYVDATHETVVLSSMCSHVWERGR